MLRNWLAGGVIGCAAAAVSGASAHPSPELTFHHLHLNDARPPFLLEFYERLFDPATTRRTRIGDADGLQSGPMLLLISRTPRIDDHPSALWHFGWGEVSLGETYLAHARREVAWEPPLPAGRLHLHLRSVSPPAAIAWYRDALGASVQTPPDGKPFDGSLPAPEHRVPEALVRIGEMGLLIYRAEPPLLTSRGQTADHLALACSDLDGMLAVLRQSGATVVSPPSTAGGLRSAMIEGPDRLAIELVESR